MADGQLDSTLMKLIRAAGDAGASALELSRKLGISEDTIFDALNRLERSGNGIASEAHPARHSPTPGLTRVWRLINK